jgi:hypothetical protein
MYPVGLVKGLQIRVATFSVFGSARIQSSNSHGDEALEIIRGDNGVR